jgi:hypothetical protein
MREFFKSFFPQFINLSNIFPVNIRVFNVFYWMAQWDEEFGYKFDALGADVSLCFLTKFLVAFFDSFNIHLLLLFFGYFQHAFDPMKGLLMEIILRK